MFSATRVNQVEITPSLNQLASHARPMSNSRTGGSYSPAFRATPRPPVRKTLCQLLRSVGKSPKLIAELAGKNTSEERVGMLTSHKLIASRFDLPSREEISQEKKYLDGCTGKWDKPDAPASGACSMLAFGGSYED